MSDAESIKQEFVSQREMEFAVMWRTLSVWADIEDLKIDKFKAFAKICFNVGFHHGLVKYGDQLRVMEDNYYQK